MVFPVLYLIQFGICLFCFIFLPSLFFKAKVFYKGKFLYKFIVTYKEDMIVQLKAEVYPTNTTFPNINVVYDEEQTAFAVDIVDQFYLNITFQGAGTVAKFSVESTDGQKYQVPVTVAAF